MAIHGTSPVSLETTSSNALLSHRNVSLPECIFHGLVDLLMDNIPTDFFQNWCGILYMNRVACYQGFPQCHINKSIHQEMLLIDYSFLQNNKWYDKALLDTLNVSGRDHKWWTLHFHQFKTTAEFRHRNTIVVILQEFTSSVFLGSFDSNSTGTMAVEFIYT